MSTALRQVFHAGIPVTLVPLDSTNTIPVNEEFFDVFQQQQETFEAQYCFKSLKIIRDNWFDNQFYTVSSSWGFYQYLAGAMFSDHGQLVIWILLAELLHVGLLRFWCGHIDHEQSGQLWWWEWIRRDEISEHNSRYFKRTIWCEWWLQSLFWWACRSKVQSAERWSAQWSCSNWPSRSILHCEGKRQRDMPGSSNL